MKTVGDDEKGSGTGKKLWRWKWKEIDGNNGGVSTSKKEKWQQIGMDANFPQCGRFSGRFNGCKGCYYIKSRWTHRNLPTCLRRFLSWRTEQSTWLEGRNNHQYSLSPTWVSYLPLLSGRRFPYSGCLWLTTFPVVRDSVKPSGQWCVSVSTERFKIGLALYMYWYWCWQWVSTCLSQISLVVAFRLLSNRYPQLNAAHLLEYVSFHFPHPLITSMTLNITARSFSFPRHQRKPGARRSCADHMNKRRWRSSANIKVTTCISRISKITLTREASHHETGLQRIRQQNLVCLFCFPRRGEFTTRLHLAYRALWGWQTAECNMQQAAAEGLLATHINGPMYYPPGPGGFPPQGGSVFGYSQARHVTPLPLPCPGQRASHQHPHSGPIWSSTSYASVCGAPRSPVACGPGPSPSMPNIPMLNVPTLPWPSGPPSKQWCTPSHL